MRSVGIIGLGVVGNAVFQSAKKVFEVSVFDTDSSKCIMPDRVFDTDFCFVCVPTPTNPNGEQEQSHVMDALERLSVNGYKGVVIVKSTLLPGSMDVLSESFPGLNMVYNPEFLTEKKAISDFEEQPMIILGGDGSKALSAASTLFFDLFPDKKLPIHNCSFKEAEIIKYIHNCILPVQLSFLNEVLLATRIDTNQLNNCILAASVFGNLKPLKVPGPDGQLGWGGMCFPKDTIAFAAQIYKSKFRAPTLLGAVFTNFWMRKEEMRKYLPFVEIFGSKSESPDH